MSRVRVGVPIPIGYNMHYSLHFTGIRVYKTEAIFGVALLQSMVRRNSIYLYPFYDIDRFIYRSEAAGVCQRLRIRERVLIGGNRMNDEGDGSGGGGDDDDDDDRRLVSRFLISPSSPFHDFPFASQLIRAVASFPRSRTTSDARQNANGSEST
ncbi:hypothetical protein V9T40_008279 [Parthenolecanium corni]|uniref:Uncharacterized protein n=1 Tax=Parthenolecanium corni TaxID=536013 RepID=A0AAN9TMU3_9HEMI